MKIEALAFACVLSVAIGAPVLAAPAATPAQAYAETLNVMAALPQPAVIDFTSTVTINGAGIRMNREGDAGALQIGTGRSFKPTDSWPATFRTNTGTAVVHASDGVTLRVRSPLFKPTWRTASIWSRYGFRGQPEATPAPATPSPLPEPEGSASSAVIGRIQSLAPSSYHIEDGPAQNCGTHPARHLRFTPLLDARTHPLTDIVIDDETKRVCEMRFRVATAAAVSLTGFVRVDFGERNGYWLVTGGGGDYVLRFFGLGMKHASMSFGIRDITITDSRP